MRHLSQLAMLMGIRGSIATQTMVNLTPEQTDKINGIIKEISKDEDLAKHKFRFIEQLTNIIRGEYKDHLAAEHEFAIAIWRATVYLLYHCDYSYSCTLCGASDYETSAGSRKAFDRQYPICPNCKQAIMDSQAVRIAKIARGYYFTCDGQKINDTYHLSRSEAEDAVQSPIKTIIGTKKVCNPDEILADKVQRTKWYSVWVWNYFRQILNENSIQTHSKHHVEISGPANVTALNLLVNELKRHKYKFYFDESTKHKQEFEVFLNIWHTSITFTAFLMSLNNEYKNYGINIKVTDYSIKIVPTDLLDIPDVQATVVTEEPVIMMSLNGSNSSSDNDDTSWANILEFNSGMVKYEQGIEQLANDDMMTTIRNKLSCDPCRDLFDIYSQCGSAWDRFSAKFGNRTATNNNVAKFLSVSTETVEDYRLEISDVCDETGLRSL